MKPAPPHIDALLAQAFGDECAPLSQSTPSDQIQLDRFSRIRTATGAARECALARPVFDSRVTPLVFGFRGGSESFMATWEWPGGEIEVEATLVAINGPAASGRGRSWRLQGQVTLEDGSPLGVAFFVPVDHAIEHGESIVDVDGSFSATLRSGTYDIAARTDGRLFVMTGLTLE